MIKSVSLKNGLTNYPSDLVCSDDNLRVSIGSEWDGTAHRPIQHPKEVLSDFGREIVTVHDFSDYTHLLCKEGRDGETWLVWCDYPAGAPMHDIGVVEGEITGAVVIGNTVVLNTQDGLLYLLWKNDTEGYKVLGGQLPDVQAQFRMDNVKKWVTDGI